ncbi:protein SHORTAGE IN CHIASMATA 1 [Cocos nucifera]|uniref:Protein SHORTAGE IN CHIASMATA 1 n=1 Tax=Cocos nucifera TaxID=13894 RepID=A0A8K0IG96_COCNU|nr:protein SHORTAGE IN CHIASMATA 1 [Cocos nucifera]
MRTRFLATDYFASHSPIETLRDFQFLPLPPSHLPPFDPPLGVEIPFFDLDLRCPSEIDGFPIENALSQFLLDVVPRFLHAGEGTSIDSSSRKRELQRFRSGSTEIGVSEGRDNDSWEEKNWESWQCSGAGADAVDEVVDFIHEGKTVEKCSDSVTRTPESQRSKLQKELRFEIVEMELPLRETMSSCEAEEAGMCFELPNIKIPLDIIDIEVGVTIPHPITVAKSLFSVEDISARLNDDQGTFSVKHGSSSPDRTLNQGNRLPQFEICENSWELDDSISTTEALDFLLPIIKPWHGPQDDGLVINAKEFLGSADIDLLEHFSGDVPSQDCPGHESISLNSVLEMDYINFVESSSTIHQIGPGGVCSYLSSSVHLQEVQIFDFPLDDVFQMFINSEIAKKMDVSELMFKDEMDIAESLYESVVSSELALADDVFRSLPTPILSDDKAIKSLTIIVGDMLRALKPHSLSACDGIYLDWHLLLEGTCNREICSTFMSILEEISREGIQCDLVNESQEVVAINVDFLDDFQGRVNTLHCNEVPTELHTGVMLASNLYSKSELTQMLNDGNYETSCSESKGTKPNTNSERISMPNMNSERISSLFGSMSQSSDLNFFLDVRRGTSRMNCENGTLKRTGGKVTQPVVSLKDQSVPCVTPIEKFGKWDIEIHQISLSDHILSLIDHIHNSYVAILEENAYLREKRSQMPSRSEVLSLPKQKLLELINEKFASQLTLGSKDEDAMALVGIYALKQLAYYLCIFGVHIAHLYLCNLTKSIDYTAEKLRCLKSLIEDVHRKAEKQLIESHPSLSHIESVLRSNIQNDKKILIVAERVFWLPLTQKLTSMGIESHEVRHVNSPAKQFGSLNNIEFINTVLEGLLHSECLLTCHEDVLPSFPFNKFSIILEYGGPYGSSRLSSTCPNLDGLPQLHFFHVKLENHNIPASLCEGFVSQHPKSKMEAVSEFMPNLHRVLNSQHIIEILNFVPTEKKSCVSSESANQVDVSNDIESANISYPMRSKNIESVMHSFPDVVIIVNTQSCKKKMLMSRRSSYQKILAMEKGGVQVVEREIDLPLDLIFSATICLVWYEAGNFGDNVSLTVETSSVPIFVENIATNILMSLSFAFSGCILIFEGGSDFLAAIMESSDALYAAAASLDMTLQLFCSCMPESTDEIILNCIRNVTKLGRGLYPAMPESETLGEAFLTRFPSINPLSAHAILSSGGILVEFLEWSHEHRIRAIGKYHVSDESISLFSTLCRYGEMGESKSVMTECSSVDSEINSGLLQSPRKRTRNASRTISMPVNDFFSDGPPNETINEMRLPQAFQPYQLRKFSNIQNKLRKTEGHSLGKRQAVNTSIIRNHDGHDKFGREYLNEDFSDEVIDHCYTLEEMFPCKSKTSSFSRRSESRSEPAIRSSLPTRREAFNTNCHCTFPTSAEINHDKNKWTSLKDQNLTLDDKIFENTPINSSKNDINFKQQDYLKEDFMQDRTRNILGLSTQERLPPLYGEIPYPSPNQSTRQQQVPGWTIELLHRVKKKSRGPQQTLSCNTCLNCTRRLKNNDPPSRSQNPSIFDSYRYQGSTQTKQTGKQKWRKDIKVQLNSNNEEKKSSLINPTWTPIDKRARQNLSFMRNGNEKQSKLVWRNRSSPITGGNPRKRYQEEG